MNKSNLEMLRSLRKRKKLYRLSPEEHYKQYEKLLYQFVHKNRWRGDYDELKSIANEAYVKSLQSYNPAKGEFSTHLFYSLRGAFSHIYPYEYNQLTYCEEAYSYSNPLQNLLFREQIESLSCEAQEVVYVILNTPQELVDMSIDFYKNCHISLNKVRKYLVTKGWKHQNITLAFIEIKGIL